MSGKSRLNGQDLSFDELRELVDILKIPVTGDRRQRHVYAKALNEFLARRRQNQHLEGLLRLSNSSIEVSVTYKTLEF